MRKLVLPRFDIPELPDRAMAPVDVERWLLENLKSLEESGQLESLRNRKERIPSRIRFRL
jgi:hypothetical protein